MIRARYLALLFAVLIAFSGCQKDSDNDNLPPANRPPAANNSASPVAANPTGGPNEQEKALLAAAVKGDTATVKQLLDKGVSVNAQDYDTSTPLDHAVWFGHMDTVKLLIERGADVNARKKDGSTPLQLAAYSKHPEIAEVLKKAGAK